MRFGFVLVLLGLSGAVPAAPRLVGGTLVPAGAVKGDFDGDGAPEFAWAVPPPLTPDSMDCVGECRCVVQFSNPAIKPLAIGKYIGGALTNLGDLNDDGKDDLGVLPDWFTSCWRSYLVFSYAPRTAAGPTRCRPLPCIATRWKAG
ncbi:hypothetical protein [Hymenobacter nivis]|uniref:VCBS repeat-containing protein n=1 Tax=Hymenobacter nivis TaxID=1850093 RepID=A0A2Z3GMA7_9BACT|nr:hypothetical protein [Hymenobacter nivis]AWM33501.1 hypothetical protein DDQ68_12320 [Hymenobacter nivis]